ncbi:SAM-dependent methyltransferase [Streptomyces antimicrobicus]|uniref:SAM-dependent methyltransferase n=1 Tax=Streptomyces antimicrobicus TaxID=2883108 RepID=A0ABS8BEW1_9ACTN|nr:SAM-dependent methyltransferase [Streptomyces antimicrobicus]MCB5183046.1 SAM-dependent methyltransferase [Streptomyces antimicrobicus]
MSLGETAETRFIDTSQASAARMYDWLLGGTENYEVDRQACSELLKIAPSTQQLARTNRDFLRRVVRDLAAEKGISQFLDHGSGLPTQDNVHEVAQRVRPGAKVVYVDNDPMVLAHARTSLDDNENTMVLGYDMRRTEDIRHATEGFLDWEQPIAALFVSVLHCLPDTDDEDDPAALIKRVAGQLAPGSYMVVCQLVSDDPAVRQGVTQLMEDVTQGHWGRVREKHEVRRFFDPLEIEPEGLMDVIDWKPDSMPPPLHLRPNDWVEWGGVGRVPV